MWRFKPESFLARGWTLASSCLMHVNRNYVFQGGSIDVRRFFRDQKPDSASREVAAQADISVACGAYRPLHAEGTRPTYGPPLHRARSRASSSTAAIRPRPTDHIGYLPRLHASAAEELEEMGVESIRDIPDDFRIK